MKLPIKTMLSAIVSCAIISSNVSADDKMPFYLSGKFGSSFIGFSKQKMEEIEYGERDSYIGNSRLKNVFSGEIAIGYNFYDEYNLPLRTEIDFTMRNTMKSSYKFSNAIDEESEKIKNKISLNTFMFNAYYDFKNQSILTPYISLGAGVANIKHKMNMVEGTDTDKLSYAGTHFAWSVGVGSQFTVTEQLAVDLSYRYLNAGTSVLATSHDDSSFKSKQKISTNDVMLGLVYKF